MVKGVVIALVASAAVAAAAQDEGAVGVYRLKVSPEARSMARMVGRPEPEGLLKLAPDHTFKMSTRTPDAIVIRGGRYAVDGTTVTLRFRNHEHLVSGLYRGGRVVVEGLVYERDDARNEETVIPLHSDAGAVYFPDPTPPKAMLPREPSVPTSKSGLGDDFCIVGNWTIHKDGLEDASTHICFDKDGTFSYSGRGAKSAGKYLVHDGCVTLNWTQIDEDAVEFGTVKKDFPISPDGQFFKIDVYRYERSSKG